MSGLHSAYGIARGRNSGLLLKEIIMEKIIPGATYSQPAHFEDPWWRGLNDATAGNDYDNIYTTVTSKFEYQIGFTVARRKPWPTS